MQKIICKRSLILIGIFVLIISCLLIMTGCEEEKPFIAKDIVNGSAGLEYVYIKDRDAYAVCGIGECKDADIRIAEKVNGKPVIGIKDKALYDADIISVQIPDSVEGIGRNAFSMCKQLASITIGTMDSKLKVLGISLFYLTDVSTVYYKGTMAEWLSLEFEVVGGEPWNYNWDRPVTVICDDGKLYYRNDNPLESPEKIPNDTPNDTPDTPSVNASEGLEFTLNEDGKSYYVSGIGTCTDVDVVIPAEHNGLPVTGIAMQAFVDPDYEGYEIIDPTNVVRLPLMPGNPTVRSIVIPDTVKNIAEGAFYGCIKLTDVTIPASVETIGVAPFVGCLSLVNIKVDSKNVDYQAVDGNIYSKDGKTLVQYAPGKTGQHFVVPNSVTSIGDGAFCLCTGLTNVTIPNSVTTIGEGVFCFCTGLTSVTIPDSVTTIDDCALRYCFSLTSVTIPDGVTTIGASAFEFCVSLTNLEIPNSVATFGKYAFASCNLTSVTYKGTVSMWKVLYEGHFGRDCTVYCTDGHISKDGTVIYN